MFTVTAHAAERAAEIGVPHSLIIAALQRPDSHRRKRSYQIECTKHFDSIGFGLSVVADPRTGDVITVYPADGVHRSAALALVTERRRALAAA